MNVTKKYTSKKCALEWAEFCKKKYPEKEITLFRDLKKVSTFYVGVLVTKTDQNFILECGTVLQRYKFSKIK